MHKTEPLVSILVPTYNQDRYIGRCLRSLLAQSASQYEYEIIVINDASTDMTGYALELFTGPADSNLHLITNSKNLGLSASLNIGLHYAQGKYIVRVDSDDFVNTNFVRFLHYFLQVNHYADAVACDYLLIDDQENEIMRCNCLKDPIACGIMFKKDHMFDVGLYDETFLYNEEKEFRLRFEKKYSIHRLELPLYRYRRHQNNITNDVDQMKFYENLITLKHKN